MFTQIVKSDNQNPDFLILIKALDTGLNELYGELQKEFDKHNTLECINDVVILYLDGIAVGCGAYKEYNNDSIEIKRVYVAPEHRCKGFAKLLIGTLEAMAKDVKYRYSILETGNMQYEAIGLYKSMGYQVTQNYEPYIGNSNSICMKKEL